MPPAADSVAGPAVSLKDDPTYAEAVDTHHRLREELVELAAERAALNLDDSEGDQVEERWRVLSERERRLEREMSQAKNRLRALRTESSQSITATLRPDYRALLERFVAAATELGKIADQAEAYIDALEAQGVLTLGLQPVRLDRFTIASRSLLSDTLDRIAETHDIT